MVLLSITIVTIGLMVATLCALGIGAIIPQTYHLNSDVKVRVFGFKFWIQVWMGGFGLDLAGAIGFKLFTSFYLIIDFYLKHLHICVHFLHNNIF